MALAARAEFDPDQPKDNTIRFHGCRRAPFQKWRLDAVLTGPTGAPPNAQCRVFVVRHRSALPHAKFPQFHFQIQQILPHLPLG
jgi:hypothetical protein